jgi:hypothetical protein
VEAHILRKELVIFSISALLGASSLAAQAPAISSSLLGNDTDGGSYHPAPTTQNPTITMAPFSQIAIGGSFSTLGPGVQITTNLASHLNLRATGNGFAYSTNFTTSGFNANAKLNMASAGIAADIYPFRSGFRISPGLLVLNNNKVHAAALAASGTSFTLNGDTYYSATANAATGVTPLSATGLLGLNTTKPAFTIAAGWGNTIPRNGGHWSFPAEVGVGFTGAPSVAANLSGWACQDQAQTECTNVASATDTIAQQIQSDLSAQIAKWKNNLNPLKTYPIASFGVAYSFGLRGAGVQ